MQSTKNVLALDPAEETGRIVQSLRRNVLNVLRRRGAVVGISGGVDSSVVLALCVQAFGPKKVVAVMMPDKDSDPESEQLARRRASCSLSGSESLSGIMTATTFLGPNAWTQRASTTEESTPPLIPTTAPRRRRTFSTLRRNDWTMRPVSSAGSSASTFLVNCIMIFWCWHFGIETNSDGIGFGQGARHLEPRHEAMMQQLGGDDSNHGHLVRLADRP